MDKKVLAFCYYPNPNTNKLDITKEYYANDLKDEKMVEELFDYAQILEASIEYDGWEFLIKTYGYKKLFEIDKKSGWLSDKSDNLQDYIEWVEYEKNCVKNK